MCNLLPYAFKASLTVRSCHSQDSRKRLTLNLVKGAASSDDAAGLVLVACDDPFRGDYDGVSKARGRQGF